MKGILICCVLFISCLSFVSCKKKGCMDSKAINYNNAAEKDNSSCEYVHYESAILHNLAVYSVLSPDTNSSPVLAKMNFDLSDSLTYEYYWVNAIYSLEYILLPMENLNSFVNSHPIHPLDRTLRLMVTVGGTELPAFFFKIDSKGQQLQTFDFKNAATELDMKLTFSCY